MILDLNGHVLKFTGSSGSVICVGNPSCNGTLTVKDSNPTATHSGSDLPAGGVITGGKTEIGVTLNSGGIYVENGSVTMNSGSTISGCTAANNGS